MNRDYFQEALLTFNGGNWYSWKKTDSDGNNWGTRVTDSDFGG